MKRSKLRFFWFVLILISFAGILVYARLDSTIQIKKRIYNQWKHNYVIEKDNQAYVKTTNSSTEDVVLSESQGYGTVSYTHLTLPTIA